MKDHAGYFFHDLMDANLEDIALNCKGVEVELCCQTGIWPGPKVRMTPSSTLSDCARSLRSREIRHWIGIIVEIHFAAIH